MQRGLRGAGGSPPHIASISWGPAPPPRGEEQCRQQRPLLGARRGHIRVTFDNPKRPKQLNPPRRIVTSRLPSDSGAVGAHTAAARSSRRRPTRKELPWSTITTSRNRPCFADDALKAPPEEFLYLACLHEGTGVERPDFLAVVDARGGPDRARDADAQRRRRVASLRVEPLQFGVPWARPLAFDRSRLSLVADPCGQRGRRSAAAVD